MSVENPDTNESSFTQSQGGRTAVLRPKVRIGRRKPGEKLPEIKLTKNNGVIEAIRVVCACGEEININCVYPDSK